MRKAAQKRPAKQSGNQSVLYLRKQRPITKKYLMVTDKIFSSIGKMATQRRTAHKPQLYPGPGA